MLMMKKMMMMMILFIRMSLHIITTQERWRELEKQNPDSKASKDLHDLLEEMLILFSSKCLPYRSKEVKVFIVIKILTNRYTLFRNAKHSTSIARGF